MCYVGAVRKIFLFIYFYLYKVILYKNIYDYVHLAMYRFSEEGVLAQARSKTPPVTPQLPGTTWPCLGPRRGFWCHYFLARASGRAWARDSAWWACQKGRAPVRSSRLKKVGLLRQRSYSRGCLGTQMGGGKEDKKGGEEREQTHQ